MLFWLAFGPAVTGEYVTTDDAAQHVFWLYAYTGDHGFVPGDPMVAHAELIQPFGFWALMRGAVLLFDPMDLSRWLPLAPEVVACMAGLTRMPARGFHLALACGSIPLGFVFAAVGHAGVSRPLLAIALTALLPPALWLVVRPIFLSKAGLR